MTEKAENTRINILNTALKHFLQYGFAEASLRGIVKDAGLTTGAFYKYYPTKEMLFNALVDPYIEHIYKLYDKMLENFQEIPADEQTENMTMVSEEGLTRIIEYIYEHYSNFKLLFKCGDSGKYENFIQNMVEREMESNRIYIRNLNRLGLEISDVDRSLTQMIYTGFFSSIAQIIEQDIDMETAKRNIHQLGKFHTGGWERLWGIEFPSVEQDTEA
jgi:AcrR family transcriptional regulator